MATAWLALACPAAAQDTPPAKDTGGGACQQADDALDAHQLTAARDAYLEVLAANERSECAHEGLNEVRDRQHASTAKCEEGAALADKDKDEKAEQAYADALEIDNQSACAKTGLETPPPSKTVKEQLEEWFPIATNSATALGAALLVVFGLPLMIVLIAKALRSVRKPSLAIRKLEDGGVDDKLGVAVRALIEERLMKLAVAGRDARQRSGLDLDLVLADVDIFADQDDLAQAAGGISDVPQVAIAMAIVNLISRLRWRYFAVDGELLPSGNGGEGLALALSKRNSLRARGALWIKTADDWAGDAPSGATSPSPSTSPPPERPKQPRDDNGDGSSEIAVEPYYRLAIGAAAWVQFNVGRSLDRGIDVLTRSGESFARVSAGLEHHRRGELESAIACYRRALERDVDNVAALANLGIACRDAGMYRQSLELLSRAHNVLEQRYRQEGA